MESVINLQLFSIYPNIKKTITQSQDQNPHPSQSPHHYNSIITIKLYFNQVITSLPRGGKEATERSRLTISGGVNDPPWQYGRTICFCHANR